MNSTADSSMLFNHDSRIVAITFSHHGSIPQQPDVFLAVYIVYMRYPMYGGPQVSVHTQNRIPKLKSKT